MALHLSRTALVGMVCTTCCCCRDDLLEGDLDDTTFGDLDGEEEDALLADDDFESFEVRYR